MRDLRDIMAELVASGLTTEQHLLVLELTSAVAVESARAGGREDAADNRSAGARRTQRWRERKASQAASQASPSVTDVTGEQASHDPSQAVTSRHEASPPRAHVRDNPSRLDTTGDLTTPDSASACDQDLGWPESDPPSRGYLDRLEAALREAAGASLASEAVAPKIRVLHPILALGRSGKGPPCDLQTDVLPTIRARAAKAPPGSVRSWDFFRDAITEARDRRLSGAPAVADVVPIRGPPTLKPWEQAEADRREGKRRLLARLAGET